MFVYINVDFEKIRFLSSSDHEYYLTPKPFDNNQLRTATSSIVVLVV